MNLGEFLKAIYDLVVCNNKFLVSLEKRIIHLEEAMQFNVEENATDMEHNDQQTDEYVG